MKTHSTKTSDHDAFRFSGIKRKGLPEPVAEFRNGDRGQTESYTGEDLRTSIENLERMTYANPNDQYARRGLSELRKAARAMGVPIT